MKELAHTRTRTAVEEKYVLRDAHLQTVQEEVVRPRATSSSIGLPHLNAIFEAEVVYILKIKQKIIFQMITSLLTF